MTPIVLWHNSEATVGTKGVSDLEPGDAIVNMGVVERVQHIGAFAVVALRGSVWSLATGTTTPVTVDVVWHLGQDVSIIERH